MTTTSVTSQDKAEREARSRGLAASNRGRLLWLALAAAVLVLIVPREFSCTLRV